MSNWIGCALKRNRLTCPRWSSGYDSALSQPRAGFDSPSGKAFCHTWRSFLLSSCSGVAEVAENTPACTTCCAATHSISVTIRSFTNLCNKVLAGHNNIARTHFKLDGLTCTRHKGTLMCNFNGLEVHNTWNTHAQDQYCA
jgi:hypothetical protein